MPKACRLLLILSFLPSLAFALDLRIRDIQSDSTGQYVGMVVTTTGIVTVENGTFQNDPIYIQDSAGPYSGILIYTTYYNVKTGDSIKVTGTVTEYYGKTEIGYISSLSVLASNCELPPPTMVRTGDLATSNPDTAEMYEGVLVGILNPVVTDINLGYGEWAIDDGSGPCRVNDEASYTMPFLHDTLAAIVGIVNYSFDNYKLEPRGDFDIYRSFSGSGRVSLDPEQLTEGVSENLTLTFTVNFGEIQRIMLILPQSFDYDGNYALSGSGFLNASVSVSEDTVKIINAGINSLSRGHITLMDILPTESGVETLTVYTGSEYDTFLSPISDFPQILVSRLDGTIPILLLRQNNSQGVPLLLGETVRITGVMTSAGEFGGQYFLEDNTAGVCVYNPGGSLAIGDSAVFQGVMTHWNGLTELSPSSVLSGPYPGTPQTPVIATCSTLSREGTGGVENFEGKLVRIDNLLRNAPVFPQMGQNMTIQDPTGTFEIRIEVSEIAGKPIPPDGFSLTGIISQYCPSSPYTTGYQLMPRGLFDIRKGGDGSGFAEPYLSSVNISGAGDITVDLTSELDTLQKTSFEFTDTSWHWSGALSDIEIPSQAVVDSITGDGITKIFTVYIGNLNLSPDSTCRIILKNVSAPDSVGYFILRTKTSTGNNSTLQEIYDSPKIWAVFPISAVQMPDSMGYSSSMEGSFVAVSGVVTGPSAIFNGSTTKTSFWIQDESGGVNIFSSQDKGNTLFILGTEVIVRGVVTEYNGVTEIVYSNTDSATIVGSGRPLPDTMILKENEGLHEMIEGRLVKIPNSVVTTFPQQSGSGSDFTARNGRTLFTVRVNDGALLNLSEIKPGKIFDFYGIVGQYTYDTPPASGYQLLPRFQSDMNSVNFGPVSESPEITVYPNPVSFAIGEVLNVFLNSPLTGRVSLRIYDIEGRLVKALLESAQGGPQLILWDGVTDYGTSAKIGVYIIHFSHISADGSETSINRPLVVGTPLE